MGTTCSLLWRNEGEREIVWSVNPTHPIAGGVDVFRSCWTATKPMANSSTSLPRTSWCSSARLPAGKSYAPGLRSAGDGAKSSTSVPGISPTRFTISPGSGGFWPTPPNGLLRPRRWQGACLQWEIPVVISLKPPPIGRETDVGPAAMVIGEQGLTPIGMFTGVSAVDTRRGRRRC